MPHFRVIRHFYYRLFCFIYFWTAKKIVLLCTNSYLKLKPTLAHHQSQATHYQLVNKITDLSNQIIDINNRLVSQLSQQIQAQAAILDQYQRKWQWVKSPKLIKARYWLTPRS